MKRLLLVLLFLPMLAQAEIRTLGWTNPTANTDGSPFDAATELAETRVSCLESNATVPAVFVELGFATSIDIDFVPGRHECWATSVHVNGNESAPSNLIAFTIDPPPLPTPNPPTDLNVGPPNPGPT